MEVQTLVLELKNVTKEREGGGERTNQEPTSSASNTEGLGILSLWPAPHTLPTELQATLTEGPVYPFQHRQVPELQGQVIVKREKYMA